VKICDSSYLIAFLHPNPNPPMDRQGKAVTLFRERISALIEELSAANDIIGIPAPALAETLVRSGPNRAQYMKILGDSWKFQLVPFGSRAAIETADLIAIVKKNKDQWDTWAKVKFDIQIVAIAKAESVSVIYSDDQDIEKFAKRLNIHVVRICDLPSPPPAVATPIAAGPVGSQLSLILQPATAPAQVAAPPAPEAPLHEEENKPNAPRPTGDSATPRTSDELEADSAHPATVRGSDEGRTEGEATSESGAKT
jgi:hypothetical protein